MTSKPTSIQINPLECKIYDGTICDKENCTEKECERDKKMTERFVWIDGDAIDFPYFIDSVKRLPNGLYSSYHYNNKSDFEDIFDILNELANENEQLKQEIEKLHEQIFSHSIEFKSLHNDYRTLKLQDDDRKLYQRELVKENEQLKHDANILVQVNKEYRVENEQLKQWNNVYKDERDYYAIRIIEVEKENKQLKQEIEKLMKNI